MASLQFPDAGTGWAVDATGTPVTGRTFTVYAASTGATLATIYADSGGAPGAAISGSTLTTDSYGYFPLFWGPTDGTDEVWVTDGVAPRASVDAVNRARLNALATSVNGKAPTASPTFTGTVSGVTKAMVGLGNVDNTSDAAKPVSTAQQTALDGKQPLDADLTAIAAVDATTAGALATDGTGWIRKTYAQLKTSLGLVKADVGLGNVDNTSDANKPVSTAQAAADATKAPLTRSIATTAPLSGGGDLSADRTVTVANATTGAVGVVQLAGDLAGTATAPTVAGLAPVVALRGTGIDTTGATDSTTAMQAIITAAPAGAMIVASSGVYKFSSLTLDQGKRLAGTGWQWIRDNVTTFGDAAYATASNFGGTVFRSTATSGVAITIVTSAVHTSGNVTDLILIGPGSGTSVGIAAGTSTRALLNAEWRNVAVANFATGVTMANVEEGRFDGLTIRGCAAAVSLTLNTNNNTFNLLNMQRCGAGLTDDTSCIANAFIDPIGQANTGTSMTLTGISEILFGGYFENTAATWAIDVAGGNGNAIQYVQLTKATDGLRVQAAAHNTSILAPTAAAAVPISNSGVATHLAGDFATSFVLTETGTHTITLNTGAGIASSEVFNAGTNTATNAAVNINGAAGSSRQTIYSTAGTARWTVRANGGAESGSNAGSDFEFSGRSDAGAGLHTTTIRRTDGRWSFPAGTIAVGESQASDFKPVGLTGATTASRYVGGTASGAPASGTFAVNDFVISADGNVYVCTTAGSPGTWRAAGPTSMVSLTVTGLTGATTQSRFAGGTASGPPTTGTFAANDFVIGTDGNLYICTVAGSPGTWVTVGTPAALNALAADSPTTGEFVPRRDRIINNTVGPASGQMLLTYFTADKTESINTLTAFTGTTAAAATPTLCRMAVYSVAGNGDITLVASTPNDTTLFAATNTSYSKGLSATFSKVVGQRYATAMLVVSGAAMPTFHGLQLPSTNPTNAFVRVAPAIIGRVLSQTDLPSSVSAASVVGVQGMIAMQLS